jgi:hypothetical protein
MAIPVVGDVDPNAPPMPSFPCWDEEDGIEETARSVRGWDESMAAEMFAGERWPQVRRDEQRICVKDADGKVSRFVVYLEMVPTFTARPVEEVERG